MKRLALAVMLLSVPCRSQDETSQKTFKYNGSGYTFFSAGACQHRYANVGVGGGAEGFVWRGLTAGIDVGYYKFTADRNSGFGVITVPVGYHFVDRNKRKKLDPFVYSGLGFGFSCCTAAAVGIGGGVNYWFHDRLGLRIGGHLHGFAEESIATFRIGLSFR